MQRKSILSAADNNQINHCLQLLRAKKYCQYTAPIRMPRVKKNLGRYVRPGLTILTGANLFYRGYQLLTDNATHQQRLNGLQHDLVEFWPITTSDYWGNQRIYHCDDWISAEQLRQYTDNCHEFMANFLNFIHSTIFHRECVSEILVFCQATQANRDKIANNINLYLLAVVLFMVAAGVTLAKYFTYPKQPALASLFTSEELVKLQPLCDKMKINLDKVTSIDSLINAIQTYAEQHDHSVEAKFNYSPV